MRGQVQHWSLQLGGFVRRWSPAAMSGRRKRGSAYFAEAPELVGRGQRHREVERLREPLLPDDRITEPAHEQRVERAEIEHRLVDVEDGGVVHGRVRRGGPGE